MYKMKKKLIYNSVKKNAIQKQKVSLQFFNKI